MIRLYNLIDANGILYRMHYGIPPMNRSDGFPTSALYGLARAVLTMREDAPDETMIAVWDNDEPTFRDELFPGYKKNRDARPEEVTLQAAPARQLLENLGIKNVTRVGFEADDVIASLATTHDKFTVTTVDKDLLQIMSPRVIIYNPVKKEYASHIDVTKKFMVKDPRLIPLVQAFAGDGSDGFKGVPGVGPSRIAPVIERAIEVWHQRNNYPYSNSDLVGVIIERAKTERKGVMWANIRSSADMIPVYLQLATLRTNCVGDVQSVLDDARAVCYDGDVAAKALDEYEFATLKPLLTDRK